MHTPQLRYEPAAARLALIAAPENSFRQEAKQMSFWKFAEASECL